MKIAKVKDQAGHDHNIKCDYMKVDHDNVLLLKYENPEQSKCAVVAVFYKPFRCTLEEV